MADTAGTVTDLVVRSCAVHAGRPALIWGGDAWSFRELQRRVAGGCSIIGREASEPGTRVAIVGVNHPAYVTGYLAAQVLGCTTVEISALESLERLTRALERAKIRFLLTDREDLYHAFSPRVPAALFGRFAEDCERVAAASPPLEDLARQPRPGDVASVMFTSGTTGLPKGVMLSHAGFRAVVAAIVEYLGLTSADRYGLVLPLSHSYGKSNLLTSLAVGAAVVLLEWSQDPGEFLARLAADRCTVASLVPFHGNLLARRANLKAHDLSQLRAVTFSGNRLPWETVDALRATLPWIRIFSMYGLTESTTRACYVPPERLDDKRESCGRPIRGVEIRIVDDRGDVLPPGGVGDVLLRGANVMLGYLDDPELTAETLVDGWLKTGDLGRLDEEGYLYLEGRTKDIIKCAGERISPSEIEEVLLGHPSVAEAAVIGVPDPMLGESVKAFVVPAGDGFDLGGLRRHCVSHLSHHKVPREYAVVSHLPRTPTGKIQKHILRTGGGE